MGISTNPDDLDTNDEAAGNGRRTQKRRKARKRNYTSAAGDILTLDLHGCQTHVAVTRALQALATRPANVRKVNLIIGQGMHSKDSASRLRPALLNALQSLGYSCRLMERNPGILEVFPFVIARRSQPDACSPIISVAPPGRIRLQIGRSHPIDDCNGI
jgi:hypothetical protein